MPQAIIINIGLALYFLVPMKATRKMIILITNESKCQLSVNRNFLHSSIPVGGSQQADNCGTQSAKYGFYYRMFLIFQEEFANGQHQDEGGEDYSKGSNDRSHDTPRRGESDVRSRINPDRSRCHLADCNNIRELLRAHPTITGYYFPLESWRASHNLLQIQRARS